MHSAILQVVFHLSLSTTGWADALPVVNNVEIQPLVAQVNRVIDALEYLGEPLSQADVKSCARRCNQRCTPRLLEPSSEVLDPLCSRA